MQGFPSKLLGGLGWGKKEEGDGEEEAPMFIKEATPPESTVENNGPAEDRTQLYLFKTSIMGTSHIYASVDVGSRFMLEQGMGKSTPPTPDPTICQKCSGSMVGKLA